MGITLGSAVSEKAGMSRAEGNEWEGTGQVPEGTWPGPTVCSLQGFSEQS